MIAAIPKPGLAYLFGNLIVKTCKRHGELTVSGIYPSSLVPTDNGKIYLRCRECTRAGHRRYHHKHKERINSEKRVKRKADVVFEV